MDPRQLLLSLFDTAVAAADPAVVLPAHLPPPPRGRTVVVGAGKASAAMGLALERNWPGELSGLIVTRYGHGAPCQRLEVVEAAHPVPDEAGRAAAERMLGLVAGPHGGRSGPGADLGWRLVAADPAARGADARRQAGDQPGAVALRRLDRRDELRAQASVGDQGRQARRGRFPARMVTLLISDVPGDDPAVIASGPTVADPTTSADAVAILARYRIELPPNVRRHLRRAAGGDAQAGRPAARPCRGPADRRTAAQPRGRGRRGAGRRGHAAAAGRCHRGRGARGRQGDGRHRPLGAPRMASRWRRRRCCCPAARPRSPSAATAAAAAMSSIVLALAVALDGLARHLGPRRRHGRHRRGRGGGGGHRHPRHARPRPRRRPRARTRRWRRTTPTACSPRSATR